MTDCGDGLTIIEKRGNDLLECLAFKINTHTTRAVTAGEQQAIEHGGIHRFPSQRSTETSVFKERFVGYPGIPVCPRQEPEQRQNPQPRYKPPYIQAAACHHDVICAGWLAVRGCKAYRVAEVIEYLPADGNFRRIEI